MENREALFDEVVMRLYDAATDMDKWPAFLDALGRLFEGQTGNVVHYDFEEERLTFSAYRGYEYFSTALIQRWEELSPSDPVVQYMVRYPGKPTTTAMVMDEETYRSTPVYKECYGPAGVLGYNQVIAVFIEPSSFMGVGRAMAAPPFDDADYQLFGRLVPHFKQALALHHRLAHLEIERENALAALDNLPTGIILADAHGRIRQANQAAEDILVRRDGLLRREGFILAHRPEDSARLLFAIRQAINGARGNEPVAGASLPIGRRPGGAYPVVVSALWRNQQKLGSRYLAAPLAALFVTDPDRPLETPADLLQRLFGLTNAEAALAARLVDGATVNEVAAEQGVSRNTVRTHLQNIFEKTETGRQAELVRKVLQTPVWLALRETDEAQR